MLHAKFRDNRPAGSGEEGFLQYIWAWRPSWSCDSTTFNQLSISLNLKACIQ